MRLSKIVKSLSSFGAPSFLVKLINDYFSNRTQFVQIGKTVSSRIPNNCGVPQGDVLAPFLFNHHTDGLCSPNDSRLYKYAEISQSVRLPPMTLLVYLLLYSMFLRGHPQMAFFLTTLNVLNVLFIFVSLTLYPLRL